MRLSIPLVSAALFVGVCTSAPTGFTGGHASFSYQNGAIGACGIANSDSALIVGLSPQRYAQSNCGRKITVTNNNNGKSVQVSVADECPSCTNENDLDLSVGAFQQIAQLADGYIPITWNYIS
ncbi:RlpA-like double-psi beta-barrel-protein domain-containing protein-containing protein [Daedaleopsis nitida]|nr:RlpA-like double-psi beta-barrel-protein domain-containing protein-containing protein [Daedaleopsis nitida]